MRHRFVRLTLLMPLLTWQDDYRINVADIDAQHHYLFALINEFHTAYTLGCPLPDLAVILTRLVAYAERHFLDEERVMTRYGYPRVEDHRAEHDSLYESIYGLKRKVEAGAATIDGETMNFLRHWLLDHILKRDMAFRDHARSRS